MSVRAKLLVVLEEVRKAPPPKFSGGGFWEAMHGSMSGYYEIRRTGPSRSQYRLFCVLENGSDPELKRRGLDRPQIVVINGLMKPVATLFSEREYKKQVRNLGDDYFSTKPRRVATWSA